MMGNKIIILKVIPKPSTYAENVKTILPPEITFFSDNGDTDYLCGKCNAVLAKGISNGVLGNLILKCNGCQSFNKLPVLKQPKKALVHAKTSDQY